jgi:hypothetical protein
MSSRHRSKRSQLLATSIFWQLAGNFSSQLLADMDLVSTKKLHATTPPRITLLAGNFQATAQRAPARICAAELGAEWR